MDIRTFVIPAIDLFEGKVVRLYRGRFEDVKVYPFSPEKLARVYNDAGFKRIHVVDLNGAEGGSLKNLRYIKEIRSIFKGEIEVGGGVRSYEVAKSLFEEGINFVVVGTLAVRKPEELSRILEDFPNRVILSIDSKGGKVAIGGWTEESSFHPEDLTRIYDKERIWGYLYTIIERDGSLEGVDVEPYRRIKELTKKPVLASGGVSSLEDVEKLYPIVDGVVVGKAIYEGRIPVKGLEVHV